MCSTCGIAKSPPLAPRQHVAHRFFITQSLLQLGWESAVKPAVAALWQGAELWRAHHALAPAERSRHLVSSLFLPPVQARHKIKAISSMSEGIHVLAGSSFSTDY